MHISLHLIVPVKVRSLSAQLDVKHIHLRFNDCAAGAGWSTGWSKGRRRVVNIMGCFINILHHLSFETCPQSNVQSVGGAGAQLTGLLLEPSHTEENTAQPAISVRNGSAAAKTPGPP